MMELALTFLTMAIVTGLLGVRETGSTSIAFARATFSIAVLLFALSFVAHASGIA